MITLVVTVTEKDGVRVVNSPESGAERLVSPAGSQTYLDAEIVARIREVLQDVTKHDDTLMWQVGRVKVRG